MLERKLSSETARQSHSRISYLNGRTLSSSYIINFCFRHFALIFFEQPLFNRKNLYHRNYRQVSAGVCGGEALTTACKLISTAIWNLWKLDFFVKKV